MAIELPKRITDAIPRIRKEIASLDTTILYAKVNHEDNFVMVITPLVVHHLMQIVIQMDGPELSWKDWWDKGFRKNSHTSSRSPDHSEFVRIGQEMARSIYAKLRK